MNDTTCILVCMLHTAKRPGRDVAKTPRAEQTRNALLQAAFQEIYKSGFQSADLDAVLETAGVTRGALYYHFLNKEALGRAVVKEVVANLNREQWQLPLLNARDPVKSLIGIIRGISMTPDFGGCPLNNLAQEMSGLNKSFREDLRKVFIDWIASIAAALREGQKRGLVRDKVDPEEAATFLVATFEGYISLAKNARDARVLEAGKKELLRYVESLLKHDT
jgi:TetR/AcrR family transcriptional regulator, transcriptional repressor for nem operon